MINPKRYTSGKRRPLMFNIRLTRTGPKPTQRDVVAALEYMLANQRTPAGWKVAMINWRDPSKASTEWRTGSLRETFAQEGLGRVIEAALDTARIAIVRRAGKTAPPPLDVDEIDDEDFDE